MISEVNRIKISPIYLLLPQSSTDSYGDPISDWSNPQRVLIPYADLQRNSTEDKDVNTGTQTDRLGVLLAVGRSPVYAQIVEGSRIEQDGKVWRVNGEPAYKRGLMFGNDHLRAALTRTTTEAPNG